MQTSSELDDFVCPAANSVEIKFGKASFVKVVHFRALEAKGHWITLWFGVSVICLILSVIR